MIWKSPISYDAQTMAKAIRKSLEDLDFKFSRDTSHRHYSKNMLIMPMPKFAYVFRFLVEEPCEIVMDMYDTYPSHAGILPFLEIKNIDDDNVKEVQKILSGVVKQLPREPWKFTKFQKFQLGYLLPDYRRAKKAWKKMGLG